MHANCYVLLFRSWRYRTDGHRTRANTMWCHTLSSRVSVKFDGHDSIVVNKKIYHVIKTSSKGDLDARETDFNGKHSLPKARTSSTRLIS